MGGWEREDEGQRSSSDGISINFLAGYTSRPCCCSGYPILLAPKKKVGSALPSHAAGYPRLVRYGYQWWPLQRRMNPPPLTAVAGCPKPLLSPPDECLTAFSTPRLPNPHSHGATRPADEALGPKQAHIDEIQGRSSALASIAGRRHRLRTSLRRSLDSSLHSTSRQVKEALRDYHLKFGHEEMRLQIHPYRHIHSKWQHKQNMYVKGACSWQGEVINFCG